MTPQLISVLSEVVSYEALCSLQEMESMSLLHMMGYQGFKRLHRYRSRDRLEHAICLKNYLVDYCDMNPKVTVNYSSPNNGSITFEVIISGAIKACKDQIERLKNASHMCIEENEDALMGKLEHLIADEERELKCYKRLWKEYDNSKKLGDASWIDRTSKCLHGKFKTKEIKKQNKEY